MANQSYCRWENTYRDFEDCYRSLLDDDRHEDMYDPYSYNKSGGSEWRAKKNFIQFLLAIKGTGEWEEELALMEAYELKCEEE